MTDSGATRRTLIEGRGLTKTFDGVTVLRNVDIDVFGGEIQALVGANGSGKSTLIKILSGYHQPSAGRVTAVTRPQGSGQRTAKEPTLAFVHQDLGLIDSMSVLENVALTCGYQTGGLGRIRWRSMRQEAATLLEEFGLRVRSTTQLGSLGGTERRLVAIARATHSLGEDLGVLVLDEPTAALPPDEVHRVFEVMALVAARGAGVLFVSHNLTETLSVARTVTVLRDGAVVARVRSEQSSVEELATYMFGSGAEVLADADKVHAAVVALRSDAVPRPSAVPAIRLVGINSARLTDVNIEVWPGEVLGVTGLVGCGKSELGRVIAGAQATTSGTISIHGGAPCRFSTPGQALASGVAYVPPDRRRFGGVLTMDARENVTLGTVASFFHNGRLRKRRELRSVATQMVEVGVVPRNPRQKFAAFSGGNQQKLVFARVLRERPRVVVLDDPTQGVDAETIPELYRFVRELADGGCGVVVITSDLDELVDVSDRVIVMQDGQQDVELRGDEVTMDKVGLAVAHGRQAGVR